MGRLIFINNKEGIDQYIKLSKKNDKIKLYLTIILSVLIIILFITLFILKLKKIT